jgi:hypothetical protein
VSTEIKPGDRIITIQDAPSLLGRTVPAGTPGRVERSGPPIVGPYSVYAHFEGDPTGRQVRPGDVSVLPSAPLDPAKVKAGDTVTLDHPDGTHLPNRTVSSVYAVMIGRRQEYLNDLYAEGYTLTEHQPAPEPEPVWKPGTVAVVVQGGDPGAGVDDHEFRAALQTDGTWVGLAGEAATAAPVSVRPLVVIDPAEVDVDHLAKVWNGELDKGTGLRHGGLSSLGMTALRRVLSELGIEATR